MNIIKLKNDTRGMTFVEVMVVLVLVSVSMVAFMNFSGVSLKAFRAMEDRSRASIMAQEMAEIARNFRDINVWSTSGPGSLTAGDDYYPSLASTGTSSYWTLLAGTQTVGDFTRSIVFDDVSRDGSDDIEAVYNVANRDPDTLRATVTVSWGNTSISLITYLTNWQAYR